MMPQVMINCLDFIPKVMEKALGASRRQMTWSDLHLSLVQRNKQNLFGYKYVLKAPCVNKTCLTTKLSPRIIFKKPTFYLIQIAQSEWP